MARLEGDDLVETERVADDTSTTLGLTVISVDTISIALPETGPSDEGLLAAVRDTFQLWLLPSGPDELSEVSDEAAVNATVTFRPVDMPVGMAFGAFAGAVSVGTSLAVCVSFFRSLEVSIGGLEAETKADDTKTAVVLSRWTGGADKETLAKPVEV